MLPAKEGRGSDDPLPNPPPLCLLSCGVRPSSALSAREKYQAIKQLCFEGKRLLNSVVAREGRPVVGPPWVEGEKIPEGKIPEVFRPPPGVSFPFKRSSLVTGGRGAGKTTLFRYAKCQHPGVSLHVSLATELGTIARQTGFGPLSFEWPRETENLLAGKTVSLIALSLTDNLSRKGVDVDEQLLAHCLPEEFVASSGEMKTKWLRSARRGIAAAPLASFTGIAEARPLPEFVSALSEACEPRGGGLLLLFDRADHAPGPCLVPIIELLDQSRKYIAAVAMRPSSAGHAIARQVDSIVGDHYASIPLGADPYSTEWYEFATKAVEAQFGAYASVPEKKRLWIQAIARDSIRVMLELAESYLYPQIPNDPDASVSQRLTTIQNELLDATQSAVQAYHPDFRNFVNDARREALRASGASRLAGPILVKVKPSSESLLEIDKLRSKTNRFIHLALRSGSFSTPPGRPWSPGSDITEIEIAPSLIWRPSDPAWTHKAIAPTHIMFKENDVTRRSWGGTHTPTIFIAYRMRFDDSKKFKRDLTEDIRSSERLAGVQVLDGHVEVGTEWAKEIRKRIRTSDVVVGDVTGLRPDVAFELGFGFGLKKSLLPVVADQAHKATVPAWMKPRQIGSFESSERRAQIVSAIMTTLSDRERPQGPPPTVPGLAVFARNPDWAVEARDQFISACKREAMKWEVLPDQEIESDPAVRRAASANLLVLCFDKKELDPLMHYIAGAVVARQDRAKRDLPESRILLLEAPQYRNTAVADSLSNCRDTCSKTLPEQVSASVERFARTFRAWSQVGAQDRRRSPP